MTSDIRNHSDSHCPHRPQYSVIQIATITFICLPMDFRPIYHNLFTTIYGLHKVYYLLFCCILLLLFFSSSVRSPVAQLLISLHLHFLHLFRHITIAFVTVKFFSLHATRIRAGGIINVAVSDTYVRTGMIFLPGY